MFRWRPFKGRVLRVTLGANPNSSSLGVDVTFLLFGAAAASALAVFAATAVRLLARGAKSSVDGSPR